jgi:tRNA A37 methylthiotransferase MiaB
MIGTVQTVLVEGNQKNPLMLGGTENNRVVNLLDIPGGQFVDVLIAGHANLRGHSYSSDKILSKTVYFMISQKFPYC